jgi:hypothetical protein
VTQDALPDWITAAATAATALASAAAVLFAWLRYRREGRAPLPIIETNLSWDSKDRVVAKIVVRNQMYETVYVDSVRILSPNGVYIMQEKYNGKGGTDVLPTTDRSQQLEWEIDPLGEVRSSIFGRGQMQHSDVAHRWLYFTMPHGWAGGALRLEFRISSAALTIRDKRMVVKRHVPAAIATQTDANASNQA